MTTEDGRKQPEPQIDIYMILKYNIYNKIYINNDIRVNSKLRKIAMRFIEATIISMGSHAQTSSSLNTEDFYTGKSVTLIPKIYRFAFGQFSSSSALEPAAEYLMCDIRSLYDYSGDVLVNPYNSSPVHTLDQRRYQRKLRWLMKYGWDVSHDIQKNKQTGIEQFTINVFSELSQYHYVDYLWFIKLSMDNLKRLYFLLNELWSYRLELTEEQKSNIHSGPLCANYRNVRFYPDDMQDSLRTELLHNIKNLISGGNPKEGGLYFLLGLVLVSPEAAEAYPALYEAAK